MTAPTGGELVAWAGFGFGSVVSIAANVLHAWLPAEPPTVAAQLGAAVWPIALLLSVEAISRVRWRSGWWWNFARFGGLGVVGLGSFAISYGHLYEVLDAWGYTEFGAMVGPIVIDGLMVISGFALLSESGAPAPRIVLPPLAHTPTDVYRLYGSDGLLLYVGITADLATRFGAHQRTKPWWPDVVEARIDRYPDRGGALAVEHHVITYDAPMHNRAPGGLYDHVGGVSGAYVTRRKLQLRSGKPTEVKA